MNTREPDGQLTALIVLGRLAQETTEPERKACAEDAARREPGKLQHQHQALRRFYRHPI